MIKKLKEDYHSDVVTLTLELGQPTEDMKAIKEKARRLGAVATYSIDARQEFFDGYITKAIKANGLYEGKYPLGTSIGRPLIAEKMVEIAKKEGADAVAHGSTGKGNDQVRFDVSVRALNPNLKIIAPMREHWMTREEAVDYAQKYGIPVPVTKKKIYSVDENLWSRSIEGGPMEDLMTEPPADAYQLTVSPEDAPAKPEYVTIGFDKGVPIALNGKKMNGVELVTTLQKLGGKHGVGRVDMIEDRLVGIKSREVYECPASLILIQAHKELESAVFTREQMLFKESIDAKWSQMTYFGQWFEPLMDDINAFIESSQKYVTGNVRLKLSRGNSIVVGRESPYSLYNLNLATYDKRDVFDHKSAEGFIKLWGLPSQVAGVRKRK